MLFYSFFYFDFNFSLSSTLKNIFIIFFGYHHLWYLSGMIFGGVILFYTRQLPVFNQAFLALILFFLGVLIQYLGNFHFLPNKIDYLINLYTVYRNFLTVCFPFLTLGLLIHKTKLNEKIEKNLLPLLILSFIFLYIEVYLNYFFISKTDPLDLMFSLFLICPLIFMFFLNKNISGKSKNLALFSTALYLIHPLFQNLLKYYDLNSISSFIVTLLLSAAASMILILVHKKMKFIL